MTCCVVPGLLHEVESHACGSFLNLQIEAPPCMNCGGPHVGTDPSCPRHFKENQAIHTRANKVKFRKQKTTNMEVRISTEECTTE